MAKEAEWNKNFNIGVDSIDNAHRKLFSIVRRLVNLSQNEHNAKATILLRNENIYLVNTHNLLFPSSNYKYFRSGLVTFLWCEPPILLMSTYHSHQFISLMYLQPHKKLCFQNVQLLPDNYFPDNKTAGCLPSH